MINWTIVEDMLLQSVSALRAELASMRTCFEAADRERSELRERAERAEAERDALRALLKECKKVMKANNLFRNSITHHELCKRMSAALVRKTT